MARPSDVGPGDHDVRDLLLGEIEDLVEHLALVRLDLPVLGRDLQQHLQLRLGVSRALGERRIDADRTLRELARPLEQPDERLEDEEEQPHGRGHAERDALGVAESESLGHELTDHDVQERDDQEREQHGEDRRQPLVEQIGEHPLAERTDGQRGQCHAELHGGDEVRRIARDLDDGARRAAALVGELLHAGSPHGHERVLACDEEGVQEDQRGDGRELDATVIAGTPPRTWRTPRRRDVCARPLRGAGTRRQVVVHYAAEV